MATRERFQARARDGARCTYCHDSVTEVAPSCPSCNSRVHTECLFELTGCPTLACPTLPRDFVDRDGEALDLTTPPPEAALLSPATLALRRTFLLPLAVGLLMSLSFVVTKGRFRLKELLLCIAIALPLALVTFPASWAELWAARRPLTRGRLASLSLLSGIAGVLGSVAGIVTSELVNGLRHSATDLWPYVGDAWTRIAENTDGFANFVIMGGFEFALLTLVRLKGLRLRWQVAAMTVGCMLSAKVIAWATWPSGYVDMFLESHLNKGLKAFYVITLGMSLALPLLSWAGEAIRWPRWFPWLASPPSRRGKGEDPPEE